MDEAQPLATDVGCRDHHSAPGLHDQQQQQQQAQLVTPTSTASTSVRTPPSESSNASPAKSNPKLLQLLGESVELMSTVLNGEHVDCQDTQAQLQAQLHNIKQQLEGTEMQMDRPHSDSTDDTWQVQDTNDRDVAAGASMDQQSAPCAVTLPAKERPVVATSDDGCHGAQQAVLSDLRDDAVSSAAVHATSSKSSTPTAASTSSTACGLPPRPPAPPAVAAAAQEQAAALATALSAVAAAAASQQLPVDTASNLAAALVRSASRARLCDEEAASTHGDSAPAQVDEAVTSSADAVAVAPDALVSDPSLDEPSAFTQPAAALLEILSEDRPVAAHELLLMAAVATEQLDASAMTALKSRSSNPALAAAASRLERPPPACEPSQQALANALHAITVEKLASAVSVPSTTPTTPPETSSSDSAGVHAAVRAALVNLPPGGTASTVKASKSSLDSSSTDATLRNGSLQRLPSATSTARPTVSDSASTAADRSHFSHTLAKMLQQHMAHSEPAAAPVTDDAVAVVPLPALHPIKVAQLRAAEGSSNSSQPGTPADSQSCTDATASALAALQGPGSLPRSGSNGSAGSSSSSSAGSVGDDAARIYSEDVALARMLLAAAEKSGQAGLMLAKLLHFTAADEIDVSNALGDSSMSALQLLASYLHNIRIVSTEAEAAPVVDGGVSSGAGPSAPAQKELAERLLTNLVDTFCSMLPVDPPSTAAADALQATVSAAQQPQHITVADVPQLPAGAGTAASAAAAPSTDPGAQVAALLSILQAAAQPAPAPLATLPAAAPLSSGNNMATLMSSLLTQQTAAQPVVTASPPNALAALLQQLSSAQGPAAPAAVVPTAPAALPVAAPVAGNDMASVLAAAMQVIAAQQQQEQQRAAMQAAMQTLVQQQHQQQQQQLAQHQLAQQHAAAAAAVAAAGLSTAQNTGLDLQSLQLLASLQQQQQQQQQHQAAVAEVLAQTHTTPTNNQLMMQASVGLPPIPPPTATAAAAVARADSQYSLQSVHSLNPLMPSSSGVAPAAASVSNTAAPAVASYNLQGQLNFPGSGANTSAPSLPASLSQQRPQSYGDTTGAAPWTVPGSDPAALMSVNSLSTASANKAGSVASLASLNSQASTVNSTATGQQAASASTAGSTVPVVTAAQPAVSSTPMEGHLAAAGQPITAVSIPAVAAALAAAQQHPGTPPSPGPLPLYDGGAGFTAHGEAAALAQQNAAAFAQMQSLEAAAAASQQQHQAAQQHHVAAAAAAAAVAAAQQQVQAQQQQLMMNELLYGYQTNAAAATAVGSVQSMMGLPATSAPLGLHYGSFSAESVEWQLWQQQQQQATQQP